MSVGFGSAVGPVFRDGDIATPLGTRGLAHCHSSHCVLSVLGEPGLNQALGRPIFYTVRVSIIKDKVGFLIIERAKLIFQQKLALSSAKCVKEAGTANASAVVVAEFRRN